MLEKQDFIFAFTLHVLLVGLIIGLNQWRVSHKPIVERTIQVKMVTLQELQEMMKPKQATPVKVRKQAQPKPKPIPQKKVKPKAVLSPTKRAKPKTQVVEEDPDYDPFAPMESSPRKVTTKKVSGEAVLHDLLQGQLSDKELDRYILGMQRAVEQQWKVPTEMIDKVHDAWVELKLTPTGKVVSIKILESSGSAKLDDTLKKAIFAAAPFDVPTKQFELFKTNKVRFYPLK